MKPEVQGVVVAPGAGRVQVDWQRTAGAGSYDVYWDNQPDIDPWAPAHVERLHTPPLVHTPVTNGRLYCYRIAANHKGRPSKSSAAHCAVPRAENKPVLGSLDPPAFRPGKAFTMTALGAHFTAAARVLVDGSPVPTRVVSESQLVASMPALPGEKAHVVVEQGIELSNPLELVAGDAPPRITDPGPQQVAEGELLELRLEATDPEGDEVRLFVHELPPGARWSEETRTLSFRPTFIQGGRTWRVVVDADDGLSTAHHSFELRVLDTIGPPEPRVVSTTRQGSCQKVTLEQRTDSFLDSQGHAGRGFDAVLVVPDAASAENKLPVRVQLHGFSSRLAAECSTRELRLYPSDPANTYWWGYSDQLPGGTPVAGSVPDYTARRVLHLLDWTLRTYPGADPERVYIAGGSMGGAGALALGLGYARHFAFVQALVAQSVARLHRPSRIAQLETLWGTPALNLPGSGAVGVWDELDMTRLLLQVPEAREQFVFLKHGKDDPTIHFSAAVGASPHTGKSFYAALGSEHVGHYAVWDEGGHSEPDPVLGQRWWDSGWDPIHDPVAFVRRDRAFASFSRSSGDRDPGNGSGNGRRAWSEETGFAGSPGVQGDTGWSGQSAGALNRFLRWDATALVDTRDYFELPLRALDAAGGAPPREGYPTTGDRLESGPTLWADVTIRRAQAFVLRGGERVRWRFGADEGTAKAAPDGTLTIPQLPLTAGWKSLVLERD